MRPDHLELLYLRRVLIGILQVTVEDLTEEKTFKSKGNKMNQAKNKREALGFIRSTAFNIVCDSVGLPACRIKTKCLK